MKDTSQKLEDCVLLTHADAQSKPMINFRTYGVYCLHNLFSFSSFFFFTSIQFFCLSQSLPLRRGEMSSLSSGRRLSITRLDRIYREKKTATADRKSPERSWSGQRTRFYQSFPNQFISPSQSNGTIHSYAFWCVGRGAISRKQQHNFCCNGLKNQFSAGGAETRA